MCCLCLVSLKCSIVYYYVLFEELQLILYILSFYQNSLIVGSSPDFNCSDVLTNNDPNIELTAAHRSSRPPSGDKFEILVLVFIQMNIQFRLTFFLFVKGGRSGICWPTFASAHNMAPRKPHAGIMSYNAISGRLDISGKFKYGLSQICPMKFYKC